ncbi:uncharacterized protein LOC119423692 [Nematolebias whitei]|uniref:uncharacterized protein LOC119423692 n=1 Tax=Nematolebias whitei TaxID=451745 RepID=UPI0018999366|nr:uncharacterized protein LOC119423692 [Nematolebias whitei]
MKVFLFLLKPIQSGKPELQSLEGTLERKHKLQLGGKKAASRGWSSYHTVLHRHALCFFQDRKDTLRRSTCGLPLNLTGAECSPASDYNKKPNCFRLRLRDGSEYLFSASSRFVMKKWIMKIQASTGPSESVSGVHADQDLLTNTKPSVCSRCEGPTSCCCSSQHDVTDTVPRQKAPSFTQIKETLFLLEELRSLPRCLNEQPSSSCSEAGWSSDDRSSLVQMDTHRLSGDILSSPPQSPESRGQRSHSFTSATYQKIKPALCSPGRRGVDEGSNYCVTLVVGDKSNVGAPRRPSPGWQQQDPCSALRGYVSLPRPRNKSVFKKFFGRKEL